MRNQTKDVLDRIREAQQNPMDLAKAFVQSTSPTSGLTAYDLEPGAKALYPVETPLRNKIPRVGAGRGTQANWKAITGININSISVGVSDGNRGGVVSTAVQEYMAAYRGIGLEDFVSFEADYAAEGFDDLKATSCQGLLRAVMIGEEEIIVGGNTSLPLGQTPTPIVADLATGGALAANAAVSVRVAALTMDAYLTGSIDTGVRGLVTRTNADGSSDTYGGGTAKVSPATAITTANDGNATHALAVTVAPVTGAVGYAWFWGTAGNELLGAITTINSLEITAAATGTQTASSLGAGDNSTNLLVFDGLISMIAKPGSNSYIHVMPTGTIGQGTPLTADGLGGIVEIDAALKHFWDRYRLSPTAILVSSQEQTSITKKVLAGSQQGSQRFVINVNQGDIQGGDLVTSYTNKYTMRGARSIAIIPHPNLPPGTILFITDAMPYPLAGISNVLQMRCRRDYYQLEWPLKTRKYEYGVYFDGVLQNYFPPAFGMITNIGAG
ncbi:MAG: hypothetical protein WCJ64_04845 [Rhodospirillaceae bacterium]